MHVVLPTLSSPGTGGGGEEEEEEEEEKEEEEEEEMVTNTFGISRTYFEHKISVCLFLCCQLSLQQLKRLSSCIILTILK